MNILLTGGTKRQVGVEDPLYDLINIPRHMSQSLVNLGHTVKWGVLDDLPNLKERFDCRIVSIAPLGRHAADHVIQSYMALSTTDPVVLYFDDFQLNLVMDAARAVLTHGPQWLMEQGYIFRGALDLLYAPDRAAEFMGVCKALATGEWPDNWYCLIPAYSWGDKSIVSSILHIPRRRLAWIDPSHTAIGPAVAANRMIHSPRVKAWFLPALNDHSSWLDSLQLAWPVVRVGQYTIGRRLQSEKDVASKYNEFVGALAPPYPQSGSGWFRSRYVYSAIAGSILAGDLNEGMNLSSAFQYSPRIIESWDPVHLESLAQRQKEVILRQLGNIQRFNDQLSSIVNIAGSGHNFQEVNE